MRNDDTREPAAQKWGGFVYSGFPSFLRAPILQEVSAKVLRERKVKAAVFGLPYDGGTIGRTGSSLGPRAIRAAFSGGGPYHSFYDVDIIESLHLHDCGDSFIAMGDVRQTIENGALLASEILKGGAMPLILGGDHTITLAGTIAVNKSLKGRYGLIHIDGHLDYDVEGELYPGNEWWHGSPIRVTAELEAFEAENMVSIGYRGHMSPRADIQAAKKKGITLFSMYDVVDIGFEKVIEQALRIATRGTNGFYLTIDIDSMEAAYAPATGGFQCFGLTTRELWPALRKFGTNKKLVGFDIVEVLPAYDLNTLTAMTAKSICFELLAARATIVEKVTPPPLKKGMK